MLALVLGWLVGWLVGDGGVSVPRSGQEGNWCLQLKYGRLRLKLRLVNYPIAVFSVLELGELAMLGGSICLAVLMMMLELS